MTRHKLDLLASADAGFPSTAAMFSVGEIAIYP
jgi:hypothetical protein